MLCIKTNPPSALHLTVSLLSPCPLIPLFPVTLRSVRCHCTDDRWGSTSSTERQRENRGRLHSLFTSLGIGILMLKANGQPFIKLTGDTGKERSWWMEDWGVRERQRQQNTLCQMGPKISEAKTPPLRKRASPCPSST